VWKIFFTSFGIMFLAELGDKTQLTILSLAGRYKSPWIVFAGAAIAMVLATGLGVLVGNFLPSVIGRIFIESRPEHGRPERCSGYAR